MCASPGNARCPSQWSQGRAHSTAQPSILQMEPPAVSHHSIPTPPGSVRTTVAVLHDDGAQHVVEFTATATGENNGKCSAVSRNAPLMLMLLSLPVPATPDPSVIHT